MAERVVYNSTELASAVADMEIDVIHLGADIEMSAGITIPDSKVSLRFNGTHEGVTHRLTDMNSNQSGDTLHIAWWSSISLTFENMDMTGRNYYGIPCIYDIGTNGVTVTYRNISYVGPQLVFNSLGLTHFENVDITILPSGASPAGEVGEVCRVEFAGNNVISHNSTADAVFWFRGTIGTAYFRLFPNAVLNISTTNYFMYNYYILTLYPVTYDIQQGASFILSANNGISHNSAHTVPSFSVGENAVFRYTQGRANETYASLYITGSFTVHRNASVYMQADYSNASPLLRFPSGTGLSLSLDNPKSFVLYNKAGAAVGTSVTRSYSIATEQLNQWNQASDYPDAGGFDDTPMYGWHNADWAVFTVTGNITQTTTTAAAPALVNQPSPITSFSYQNAEVISAGSIVIDVDIVADNGRPITGRTEPNAQMVISYTVEDTPYSFHFAAGEDGSFVLDPQMKIPAYTPILVSVNTPFLIKTIEERVATGELSILESPERIVFNLPAVATNPVLLGRLNPLAAVKISDTRPYPTDWELSVTISGPPEAESGETLENAVVFRDENNVLWDVSGEALVVRRGEASAGERDIFWQAEQGILLRLTQAIRSGVEYITQLEWKLTAIEPPQTTLR